MSKQGSNSELFAHENDVLTARPLKYMGIEQQKESLISIEKEYGSEELKKETIMTVVGKVNSDSDLMVQVERHVAINWMKLYSNGFIIEARHIH